MVVMAIKVMDYMEDMVTVMVVVMVNMVVTMGADTMDMVDMVTMVVINMVVTMETIMEGGTKGTMAITNYVFKGIHSMLFGRRGPPTWNCA